MSDGFFQAEGGPDAETLRPQPRALSQWGGGAQLRGMAVSGALARAAERGVPEIEGTADLRPVRWTLDLCRPASSAPCTATANVVRRGRRLCLVDAYMFQNDRMVARASALFLAVGGSARGNVWSPATRPSAPPAKLRSSTTEPRLYFSEGIGWTGTPAPHQTSGRKMTWHFPSQVVQGERATPFQQAAMVADVVNVVSNWGDGGLEFINADVTLALARLPAHDQELGLAAEQRVEENGVAVGSAAVFDRLGVLGTATVTGLVSASNVVDPRLLGTEAVPDDDASRAVVESRPR
ncbi:acyl-CoA thioesterase domain-containing protein [Streptomyces sp. NPDC058247]|uniref:acyl-CoA thioesterase domain-containing protein n=1 Tax=Streptomyces sp. NPDC058247 TaxID=3346401 RepID=UPI0036EBEBA1